MIGKSVDFCDKKIGHDGVVVAQQCGHEPGHDGPCLSKSLYVAMNRQEWIYHAEEGVWSENHTSVCFTKKVLRNHMRKHQLDLHSTLDALLQKLALTQIDKSVSIDT